MRFYLPIVLYLPVFLLLTACQSTPKDGEVVAVTNNVMAIFPIATAVQINYQDEVKLLRINQLLAEQKELDAEQRAQLFYERGTLYDRMGLNAHSRYDFTQAINVDPSFAPAYNSLGLYLLLAQSYDEAFEAFDSALELSESMQYSYLHRAAGLYQVQRYSLASDDIETFYALDINDPYRILWRYIINSQINMDDALKKLQTVEQLGNDHRFAWSLIDVIAGRKSEKVFFETISAGVQSNKELAQRLCESYFYLAHWHKLSGHLNKAIYYFRLSTTTNIHDFIEYKYSLIELSSIQSKLEVERDKSI
ncbi:lipoprotein NlpI [Psychromonas antarctica]|uniref:lipoprotein NlpI n=1 Tax=Psychromonas antarctica TaxID=67573 RepID=UPI001EE8DF92|nr:lipoprotein NlpI [Psychromonas antarctica]MCG6200479.1 lipoprotein NlpI [Psychromonas antarctica]